MRQVGTLSAKRTLDFCCKRLIVRFCFLIVEAL